MLWRCEMVGRLQDAWHVARCSKHFTTLSTNDCVIIFWVGGCYLFCFTCLHNAFMHVDMYTEFTVYTAPLRWLKITAILRVTECSRHFCCDHNFPRIKGALEFSEHLWSLNSRAPLIRGKLPQGERGVVLGGKKLLSDTHCRMTVWLFFREVGGRGEEGNFWNFWRAHGATLWT